MNDQRCRVCFDLGPDSLPFLCKVHEAEFQAWLLQRKPHKWEQHPTEAALCKCGEHLLSRVHLKYGEKTAVVGGLTVRIVSDPTMPPGEAEMVSSTGQRIRVTGLAAEQGERQ